MQYPNINSILSNSDYSLGIFSEEEMNRLEANITGKTTNGKISYYTNCLVRNKSIKLTPEEVVRQLYLDKLINHYNYPTKRIRLEYGINFGRELKRADIVIMDKDQTDAVYIIVETKKPKAKDGKEQLKSYCHGTGATIAVWTNGSSINRYHRKNPNYFEPILELPNNQQTLVDILQTPFTLADLIAFQNDPANETGKSLKDLVMDMEDEVLANAGVDVFEELFKLLFAKLYDEVQSANQEKTRNLEFRNAGETETILKDKIQILFDKANKKWDGVFTPNAKILLTASHLGVCVASLEKVKLFNSNLDVVDEAFEYLINKSSKGEKGQYFTPRYVIDMCVKMLNPTQTDYMIDTAAGSSGFTVHGIFHVWKQMYQQKQLPIDHLFTIQQKPQDCVDYVREKVFAIDFDERAVRVARTLNLIAGDGQTNVLHLNTLDFTRWEQYTKNEEWRDTYNDGFKKLKKLATKQNDYKHFEFDVLMANPPFAGEIKEGQMLAPYELAEKNGKVQTSVGRDILFIERNLNFLKPGGRMAIVLPQGRFNNQSDQYIRQYIAQHCRILAVVGLHGNTFKPHTGTKTSVLIVQKWHPTLCPQTDNYPIFFATQQLPAKDNSGDKLYWQQTTTDSQILNKTTTNTKQALKDQHQHPIIAHDLFNTDGLTQDGIAEAFIEFAKKEQLSFFLNSPFNETKYNSLLNGLEVSVLMLHDVLKDNEVFRIDAEYFKKTTLQLIKKIRIGQHEIIGDSYDISKLAGFEFTSYFTSNNMESNNFYIALTSKNIQNETLNISEFITIDKDVADKNLMRSKLYKHDVILSYTGEYRRALVLQEEDNKFQLGPNVCRLRVSNSKISPFYLSTFFNCLIGQKILDREKTLSAQPTVAMSRIRTITIPLLSQEFQLAIECLVKQAHSKQTESKSLYATAEALLMEGLDIDQDFLDSQTTNKPQANYNVVMLQDSLTTNRLDAEYYQPKYEVFKQIITNYPNGYQPLATVCTLKDYNFTPDAKIAYRYIELQDIGLTGEIIEGSIQFGEDLPSRARRIVSQGDVIISSIEGSLQKCAIITANYDEAICSTGFYVLSSKIINPETLLVLFKSAIMQQMLKQACSGTILTSINKDTLLDLPIPLINPELQTEIATLVQQSFALQQQSKQLLALAKQAVEVAIEQHEVVGLSLIARGAL